MLSRHNCVDRIKKFPSLSYSIYLIEQDMPISLATFKTANLKLHRTALIFP
jgi:hypothetical protein